MRKFIFISIIAFSISVIAQKRVEYDLYVHDTIVNYSGKERKAI